MGLRFAAKFISNRCTEGERRWIKNKLDYYESIMETAIATYSKSNLDALRKKLDYARRNTDYVEIEDDFLDLMARSGFDITYDAKKARGVFGPTKFEVTLSSGKIYLQLNCRPTDSSTAIAELLSAIGKLTLYDIDDPAKYFEGKMTGWIDAIDARLRDYTPPKRALTNEQAYCVICMDAESTYAFVPCGHKCVCEDCAGQIKDKCPICRAKIRDRVKIFA